MIYLFFTGISLFSVSSVQNILLPPKHRLYQSLKLCDILEKNRLSVFCCEFMRVCNKPSPSLRSKRKREGEGGGEREKRRRGTEEERTPFWRNNAYIFVN